MNVINVKTAKNLSVPRPSAEWMQKLRASMAAFDVPSHSFSDCVAEETWPGRQAVHCVYSVGLRTIIGLEGLGSIDKPLGWRFLAGGHKEIATAVACMSSHEVSGKTAKVLATLEAPEVAEILRHTEDLGKLPQVRNHPSDHYELRVIRIPALFIEAFWLKSQGAKPDLIVPYAVILDRRNSTKLGTGKTLIKNQAYTAADFLKTIRPAAQQKLAIGDNPQPSPAPAKKRAAKRVPPK